MMRTVVVGTVGNDNRQAISMVIGTYKMVGTGFGSRIRAAWIISCFFGEKTLTSERAVHFIGGNMVKPLTFHAAFPGIFGGIQQVGRAKDIRTNKSEGIGNGAINMRFGSQVNDSVE